MEYAFRLGQRLRDRVTGFEGIATVRAQYLNGCEQYCIKPVGLNEDGDTYDAHYFDAEQLELVDDGIIVKQIDTGGPSSDAPPERIS